MLTHTQRRQMIAGIIGHLKGFSDEHLQGVATVLPVLDRLPADFRRALRAEVLNLVESDPPETRSWPEPCEQPAGHPPAREALSA